MAITICDVGPRDGLQNEPETLPPLERAELVNRLSAARLPRIEAASFVRPDAVPQIPPEWCDCSSEIDRRPFEHLPAFRFPVNGFFCELGAFEQEPSEFVRPALSRSLAAASVAAAPPAAAPSSKSAAPAGGFTRSSVAQVQTLMRQSVTRGQDFFRSRILRNRRFLDLIRRLGLKGGSWHFPPAVSA